MATYTYVFLIDNPFAIYSIKWHSFPSTFDHVTVTEAAIILFGSGRPYDHVMYVATFLGSKLYAYTFLSYSLLIILAWDSMWIKPLSFYLFNCNQCRVMWIKFLVYEFTVSSFPTTNARRSSSWIPYLSLPNFHIFLNQNKMVFNGPAIAQMMTMQGSRVVHGPKWATTFLVEIFFGTFISLVAKGNPVVLELLA